ncbi:hypothetical protein D3C73_1431420 [compost metagenome]
MKARKTKAMLPELSIPNIGNRYRMNRARPVTMTGRRPKRSDNLPPRSTNRMEMAEAPAKAYSTPCCGAPLDTA